MERKINTTGGALFHSIEGGGFKGDKSRCVFAGFHTVSVMISPSGEESATLRGVHVKRKRKKVLVAPLWGKPGHTHVNQRGFWKKGEEGLVHFILSRRKKQTSTFIALGKEKRLPPLLPRKIKVVRPLLLPGEKVEHQKYKLNLIGSPPVKKKAPARGGKTPMGDGLS